MTEPNTIGTRITRVLIGAPKDPRDPGAFHKLTLIALLAWVGLGADGLSSSAYGPAEAFEALGEHVGLAVFLALATAITVLVISASYSRIIEQFPAGGGGYSVASKLLGEPVGVLAGSALLIDYVLTITISLASGADQICSFLPPEYRSWKLPIAFAGLAILFVLNVRGLKESIKVIAPIFVLFLATHGVMFVAIIVGHFGEFGAEAREVSASIKNSVSTLGVFGVLHLFARAYALGGGTYTGIEAVSNAVSLMREPKVQTAKRTMIMMAFSLAITASAILVGYLLLDVEHVDGKTMNAVLFERAVGSWTIGGFAIGETVVIVTLISSAALLVIAAQAGFIGGPRVMANLAADSWLPHRLSALSDRLTMRNGVLLMGVAAGLALLFTGGEVKTLVVMYAINVFVTFSLANVGMVKLWVGRRKTVKDWIRRVWVHVLASAMCLLILVVTIFEKFTEGAWVTIIWTFGLTFVCFVIKRHYGLVVRAIRRLDHELPGPEDLTPSPEDPVVPPDVMPIDKTKPVAILFVGGYGGLGRHALLTCLRMFPGHFKGVAFASVAVVDTGAFKGEEEVEALVERTKDSLANYVRFAHSLGLPATSAYGIGTEVPDEAVELGQKLIRECPRGLVVAGQLVFEADTVWMHILHNETAFLIQRRLQHVGVPMIVVPVKLNIEATRKDFPIVQRARHVHVD